MAAHGGAGGGAASGGGAPKKAAGGARRLSQDKDVMELLEKLKKASKAPEQAARRIRALDAMVHRLKANRRACQVAIDEDEEKLKWIEREEEALAVRLRPLRARLEDREATAKRVRESIETSVAQFQSVLGESSNRIMSTRMKAAHHRKKEATAELRAERGFSAAREASPHLQGVPRTLVKDERGAWPHGRTGMGVLARNRRLRAGGRAVGGAAGRPRAFWRLVGERAGVAAACAQWAGRGDAHACEMQGNGAG
eukprot:CAMPEP_0203816530 /NCGR_PEP_ID=MMETSP0115-20131106/15857_1 /ASSEMBLY_ACC=CAM_ASM_000227 /TAXON_ID=33651 /ORGANISM="Bicosoecid sp, Strain ms1" /LENGTH=253 /DNA_ID=CAMNT_0050725435 /DNA_START=170 /DNA_END=928 /DNA_ORIENTATION=-